MAKGRNLSSRHRRRKMQPGKFHRYFGMGILWGLLLVLPALLWAEEGRITPEMVVKLKKVRQAAISPAGDRVAYVLSVPPEQTDAPAKYQSEIWVINFDGQNQRPYLAAPLSGGSVTWTPDQKHLAFLSKMKAFDEHVQVYNLPVDGGAPRQVTRHATSVEKYAYSPDGKWIAYIAKDPESSAEKAAKAAGKDWVVYDENYKQHRLWLFNTATGESRRLLEKDGSVWEFAWSPDSRFIVFQATETPLIDDSYMFKQIYTVAVSGGEPHLLCRTEGKLDQMAYSPDGSQIAFLGAVSRNDPLAQSLFVVPATGGTPKNLTENFEGSTRAFQWLDNGNILLLSTEFSVNSLRKVNLSTGKKDLVYRGTPIVQEISLHPKTGRFAAVADAPDHPWEVYAGQVKDSQLTRLTYHNPALATVKLGKQEIVEWSGPDGLRIEGILTYPVDYQPGQKYPLALQVHGGPEGVSLNGWNTRAAYPVQVLAANGYFVLEPNYRGSGGRGVAFARADHDDLGGKEYEDVLAGVDFLINQGLVDAERVGTGGWSYGGYFSAWAATKHSNRFKAAMVAAGLTNWISFAGTTDIPYEMSLVHWNNWWYDHMDLHWERSPLAHINNAKTPTLIVHGDKDERVHLEQSIQLYTALKLKKVPARLVVYPREPHGLLEYQHSLHFIQTVLEWFNKYLKNAGDGQVQKDAQRKMM